MIFVILGVVLAASGDMTLAEQQAVSRETQRQIKIVLAQKEEMLRAKRIEKELQDKIDAVDNKLAELNRTNIDKPVTKLPPPPPSTIQPAGKVEYEDLYSQIGRLQTLLRELGKESGKESTMPVVTNVSSSTIGISIKRSSHPVTPAQPRLVIPVQPQHSVTRSTPKRRIGGAAKAAWILGSTWAH